MNQKMSILFLFISSITLGLAFRGKINGWESPFLKGRGISTKVTQGALFATISPSVSSIPASAAHLMHSHLRHEPQFKRGINEIKRILSGQLKYANGGASLFQQIKNIIVDPIDIAIVIALIMGYKPALKSLYTFEEWLRRKFISKENESYHHTFNYSIWGYLEEPFRLLSLYMPFLYALDLFTILLHALGLDAHIKGDFPRLAATCATSIIGGTFIVHIKNWVLHNSRIFAASTQKNWRRDDVKERTVDELTNIIIWAMVFSICVEAMSLNMGFALGSVFAVGGIGSASIVLALRSTFENIVGGLLLKLQDKFRVGEVITIPSSADKKGKSGSEEGRVESITYITTTIRRDDNSLVNVPNHVFTHGEIINWSRTPYRLLKLQLSLNTDELAVLPPAIAAIKSRLASTEGVEAQQRSIVVAATGFKDNKLLIDVTCHLVASSEEDAAECKTNVCSAISQVLEDERSKFKAQRPS